MTLLLAMLLGQSPAAERLHVDWVAPEGCPSRDAFSSLASTVPKDRTFSASVRIDEPNGQGPWRAVVITRAHGERTRVVEALDCPRVAEAAVLVVTLAATTLETPPEPPPRDPLPPVEPPLSPLRARPEPPKEPPWELAVRLRLQPSLAGSLGVFATPGVGAGLSLGLEEGRLRAEVGLLQWLESQTPGGQRGATFQLTSFFLRGGVSFEPIDALKLSPGLSLEGGPLSGTGLRVASPTKTTAPWLAALAGLSVGYRLSSFARLWATLEVGLNLIRPVFTVSVGDDPTTVHSMGWPVGRLSVGVEFFLRTSPSS